MKKQNSDSIALDVERILGLLGELQRRVSFRLYRGLSRGKITMPQFVTLQALRESGKSTMSDLARQMCVSRAAMTSVVNRLFSEGYVGRERSRKDRRVVRVRITPKGRRAADKIRGELELIVRTLMEKMSSLERRVWVETYERICTLLKEDVS